MSSKPLTVRSEDGYGLAATWHQAVEPVTGLTVILAGELGFLQTDYARYATYLSEQGIDVVTFDYRDMGQSGSDGPGKPPRLIDLGRRDLAAIIGQATKLRYGNRLLMVGHGVGGVLAGLAENNHHLQALLCVAASTGYIRKWPLWLRPFTWFLLRFYLPLKTRLSRGEMASELGPAVLPSSILRDWAQWCRHPQAPLDTFGVPQRRHFESWRGPIRHYCFSDDPISTPSAVRALGARFTGAPQELIVVDPQSHGLQGIGHAGFFAEDCAHHLWDDARQWMHRVAPGTERPEMIEV